MSIMKPNENFKSILFVCIIEIWNKDFTNVCQEIARHHVAWQLMQ